MHRRQGVFRQSGQERSLTANREEKLRMQKSFLEKLSVKYRIAAETLKTLKEEQVGRAKDIHVSLIAWSDDHLKSNPNKSKYNVVCEHDYSGALERKNAQSLEDAEKIFESMVRKYKNR
jgi:hypothetical protein